MYPLNYQYQMYATPSDIWYAPQYPYQQQQQQLYQPSAVVKVENEDQWSNFRAIGTNEMIVCKKGRSLFPLISYKISNIDEYQYYTFTIKMERVDNKKYRYTNEEWKEMPDKDVVIRSKEVRHDEGFKTGKQWMEGGVSFNKLKITNNLMELTNDNSDNDKKKSMRMVLQTMVKYRPVLTMIQKLGDQEHVIKQFRFDGCQFITVTGYQSTRISKLKTELNKYASGLNKKRKLEEEEKKENENEVKKTRQGDTLSFTNSPPLQPINQTYPMYPQYSSGYTLYYPQNY